MRTAVVVGAGIQGLTTAYYLAREGMQVTVVDSAPQASSRTHSASFANAAVLRASQGPPLASPGTVKAVVATMLPHMADPQHVDFGYFKLRAVGLRDPALWGWGVRFALASMGRDVDARTKFLSRLARYSMDETRELIAREELDVSFRTVGCISVGEEGDPSQGSALTAEQAEDAEPALRGRFRQATGGAWDSTVVVADCYLFCQALEARCRDRYAVRFLYNTSVLALRPDAQGLSAESAVTTHGDLHADVFVLCTGDALDALSPTAVPVTGMRGYSITYPAGPNPPKAVVIDNHVYITPLPGNRVRFTSVGEIGSNHGTAPDSRVVDELHRTAQRLYPEAADFSKPDVWVGRRPISADDVPIVSKTSMRNVYLNGGHGMLGWRNGCGAAHVLADLIVGRVPALDTHFLDASRFGAVEFLRRHYFPERTLPRPRPRPAQAPVVVQPLV